MLISNWKENFKGFGSWTATNCITADIPHSPKIVETNGSFGTFGGFGEILNMGEAFETFEEAAKFMESIFTWEVELNGRTLTLTGDNVNG